MKISSYLFVILMAWVIAQGMKYVIAVVRDRNLNNLRQLYVSGNMPSAHSCTTASLATLVGLHDGFDSAIFALSALFAAIVMYDAVMVRRSVGEQGAAIRQLIHNSSVNKNIRLPRAAKGHTPLEVLAGATLGVVIGAVVFFATT